MVTCFLSFLLASVGVEENIVDSPGLGQDGAKHQREGNAGNPYPQLLVLCGVWGGGVGGVWHCLECVYLTTRVHKIYIIMQSKTMLCM